MISQEDRDKQKELQDAYGERCAFFSTPVGLVALAPPEQAAEAYWKMHKDQQNDSLEKTTVIANFAKKFIVYPDVAKVAPLLRKRPALAVRLGAACRKMIGEDLTESPELDEDEFPEELAEITKLREKHGFIVHYMIPDFGLLVFAPPEAPATYRQFFNAISGDDDREPQDLYETFVLDCTGFPSRDRVKALLRERPGIVRRLANTCERVCGGEFEELGKV